MARTAKAEITRRRQRLSELVAGTSSPSPIHVLARALGVSRRTVQRDVTELARNGDLRVIAGRRGGVLSSDPAPSKYQFVLGRDRELSELTSFLKSREPGILLISGEQGAGKSTVLKESLRQRPDPIIAWCSPSPSSASISPVAQIARQVEALNPSESQTDEIGPANAFQSLHRVIARSKNPVLLVVEDAHWADPTLREFISILISGPDRESVQLIITFRPGEIDPGFRALTADMRRRFSEPLEISLGPLDAATAAAVIRRETNRDIGVDLSAEIIKHCRGNALYLREYARLLGEDRRNHESIEDVEIPQNIIAAVIGRILHVSDSAKTLIEAVATDADGFSVDELLGIVEAYRIGPDALDEAVLRGFVDLQADRVQINHEVVRQAVYSGTGHEKRRHLHGLVATYLRERSLASPGRLAHHNFNSDLPDRRRSTILFSIEAGERDLVGLNAHGALSHFKRAESAIDSSLADEFESVIKYGLARSRAATEESDAGHWMLLESFEEFLRRGDTDRALHVALWVTPWPNHPAGGQIMARAMEMVAPRSIEEGHLRSRYGAYLGLGEGQVRTAVETMNEAIGIARNLGNHDLMSDGVSRYAMVAAESLLLDEARAKATQGILLSERLNKPGFRVHNHYWLAEVELMEGNPGAAQSNGNTAYNLAIENGYFHGICQGQDARVRGLILSGAMSQALETVEPSPVAHSSGVIARSIRAAGARAAAESGRPELASQTLLELLGEPSFDTVVAPSRERFRDLGRLSQIARITGNQDIARLVDQIATVANLDGRTRYLRLSFNVGRALAAHLGGNAQMASQALTELEIAEVPFDGPGSFSVHRAAALAASVLGDRENTESHFEAALVDCSRGGCFAELTWASIDYATVLRTRSDWKSRVRARELTAQAVSLARHHGLVAALREAEAIEALILESTPVRNEFLLTNREMEILTLVGQGLTDVEIGKRLFLSHHTVTYHVRNALRKTGQPNRAAAAMMANRLPSSASAEID